MRAVDVGRRTESPVALEELDDDARRDAVLGRIYRPPIRRLAHGPLIGTRRTAPVEVEREITVIAVAG